MGFEYRIWGRLEQTGPGQFEAIISVVPVDPLDSRGIVIERETRSSRQQAVEAMRRKAIDLGQRIRERGDEVLDVEIE